MPVIFTTILGLHSRVMVSTYKRVERVCR